VREEKQEHTCFNLKVGGRDHHLTLKIINETILRLVSCTRKNNMKRENET
jgi:hypothetical protein